MVLRPTTSRLRAAVRLCLLGLTCAVGAGALAVAGAAAYGRAKPSGVAPAAPGYTATLEQCTTSATPAERSVTFTGQMVATPGTQRMGMRIELLEHTHGEIGYHAVTAPTLGTWRGSEAGVKIYRYVKQITNLAAPAVYRAVVHFHWLGDKGRVIKRAELRTAKCVQPLLTAPSETPSGASSGPTGGASSGSGGGA